MLGDRVVCTDTTAPYSCLVKPTLADVGLQSLRVVITDRIGQSTTLERQVRSARFGAGRREGSQIERKKVKGCAHHRAGSARGRDARGRAARTAA